MTASSTAAACELLCAALPGRVTLPNDTDYEALRTAPWAETCWTPAACFVHPQSPKEVATAIKTIRNAGVSFSIRATGHNPNRFVSSSDESGVVIDLGSLKTLSIDESGEILSAGAGCRWGEVYEFLEGYGRTAIGARQLSVGIAGMLLGGGISTFPNLYGLSVDSVTNFEVVLADSSIINANAQTNTHLFKALKGGGSNFGIVTRFDIQTYPQIPTQRQMSLYQPSDYVSILRGATEVQEAMEDDPKLGMIVVVRPAAIAVILSYADKLETPPKAFEAFTKLDSHLQTLMPKTDGTLRTFAESMGPALPTRRSLSAASSKVSHDLYVDFHKHFLAVAEKYPDIPTLSYAIGPVSSRTAHIGEERGGNSLGLEPVAQTWWHFFAEWQDEAADTNGYRAVEELSTGLRELAIDKGQHLDLIFMNNASNAQDVMGSYGAGNLAALKATATKYDPSGFFQTAQKGGFLLRDAK